LAEMSEETNRDEQLRRLAAACGFGSCAGEVDEGLIELADAEQLAPFLGMRVFKGELRVADPAVAERLVAEYRHCAIFNASVEVGSQSLGEELARRGIPAVLLKGAALINGVFHDPGARRLTDLDALVPAARWSAVLAAVKAVAGRTFPAPGRAVTLAAFHEVHAEMPGGAMVDLHRHLHAWPLFRIDHAGVFERSSPFRDGWNLPDPVDLFVSLGTHAAQDGFVASFRYVIDALALASLPEVSAGWVAERAMAWRARRATALWLRALQRFGLVGGGWEEAVRALDPAGKTARRAVAVPRAATVAADRWFVRRELLRSLDGPLRPLAFVATRGMLYLGDLAGRVVGHSSPVPVQGYHRE
jgi:Uncharacterised nucleotidyltransferase